MWKSLLSSGLASGLMIMAFGTTFAGNMAVNFQRQKPSRRFPFSVPSWIALIAAVLTFVLGGIGGGIYAQRSQQDSFLNAYLSQGDSRYAQGNYDASIAAYTEAIRVN